MHFSLPLVDLAVQLPNSCRALPDEARPAKQRMDKNEKPAIAKALAGKVVLSGQFSNHFLEDLVELVKLFDYI